MNDNINKIQKILQNKVGYQGSSADLMKYLETPENKEKLVKILNKKVGYEGTVDDFNSYVGIQVPKVEGIQTVSAPSIAVGAPEVNVMSPLASNVPTAPKVDWATQEEGSITKPIAGELEREQPVNFEGMTPDPKNDPDYSVTNQSGKFVYTFDKEKSDRRKEKDAFLTLIDEQMKESNKRLEESMAAVKKYNEENPYNPWENYYGNYSGATFAQHEVEKLKDKGGKPQGEIFATQAILKDAEQTFKAPKKGENWAKSFGIGVAETVTDPDAWLFGILSLNEVQQSMSVFEKVDKGEPLTDTESALMDAMLTRTQAEAMRSSDTSNWYKGGKIAGEALPFMRDMAMTGGLNTITTAAGKGSVKLAQRATAKYLRKKAEKQLLKEGIEITEDILSRRAADLFMRTAKVADYTGRLAADLTITPALKTPLQPTAYAEMGRNMQGQVVGNEFGTYQIEKGDDIGVAAAKTFMSRQSEGVGTYFNPALKGLKFVGGKLIPKAISNTKLGQFGGKMVDFIIQDNSILQKAGISGYFGENLEEVYESAANYVLGLSTKEDLKSFYTSDNLKSMLIGTAPMSALGMAGNAINYGSNEVQYRMAKKELGGITDELDNSSVGELGNKMLEVLVRNNAFDEKGNLTKEGNVLNQNMLSYAQRKMAKDIANDGKRENPNSKYYDFLLNERSKKWLESYLADNDLTAPMYFNLAYKATLHENELTDYERKTLSELDRAFNGYLKAEDAAQQASAEIDAQVNPTNNKIQNVMVGGQPHMVKGGNIVMTENEEGKAILDKENSDQVITVVNAEGIPSQIGIEQLESVVGEVDAEEAKNAAIESAHTTAYNETFYPVGAIVYRKDAQGQFSAIKETGADGFTINTVTEGGEVVPTLIENTNSENFGVISLKAGDKYTLNDGTQLDIISNEGGVISASVNGQPSEQTTADELATLFESTGIDLTQFEPSEEDVTETEVQEPQQPIEPQQVEETQQVQETEAPEAYPTDKKGEPIFEQMPVEQSIKVVREVLGDDAVNFVEDKLKAADKAVKAVAKKAPKSTSLLGRKAEVEAIALEKQKATESLDYWTNVKRLMSEEAIQATREQAPINQVVENPNQVGQVIIDRYESAKKVIGNSATITAPNGKVLKGRYVLVSAYAVTPSHNPFDGYNTSEGFPLNADGSNTNQRDYKNDKANQVVTDGIANSFDGRALENVPKVSKDGVVFDGNGRTIASQLAAANNTDKAYLEALNNNAANYGFTAADLKSVSNPRIVFELETELPYTTEAFAMFNSEEKKSESATASAVAKSKQLSPSSVAKIAALVDSYSSLESFFSSETATAEMVKTLVDAKVINTLEIAKLIDNGLFSATGRELITNVLLGATLNEQAIRQIGNDSSLKGIIVRAMKQILENAKLKEYSLFEDINNAIGLLYEARKAKMSVSDFLLQTNMFEKGASERFSDFEQMLALAMSDSGVLFKGTIDKYNTVAAPLVGGQVDMFTGRILNPNEVKQQIIEYYGKTKSSINPNAGVDGRNRGSETTRTGRTDSGRISLESAQAKFDAAITVEEKYKAALEVTLILDEQNNTKTIVAKDNEEFISMLPTEYSEIIRVKVVGGVFFKGNVIINAEKLSSGQELILVYEHEWVHNANRNVHSSEELSELWNNSTHKKRLPKDYLGSADNVKGDELIAHIIEDIIQKQGYENYKNGNIDLSLYSQQEQLKKTIDYANKEYLRNVRGGNSRGNLYEDNNARQGNENLQQTDEGRQTPKFRRKDQGELTEVERNVQGDVSQGSSRVLQPVTTETLLIDGVERPTRNSNGAYIHSTEEGIRNFWRWFGDSKVVDNEGRPLVVYHGTNADFNKFKPTKPNFYAITEGTYFFTDNENVAANFGKYVMPVYLNIDNPTELDGRSAGRFNTWELNDDSGNYGWIVKNSDTGGGITTEYAVENPTQIKSATGNLGTFDPNNADIRFAILGERGATALDKAEEATTRLDNLAVAKKMDSNKKIKSPENIEEYINVLEQKTGLKFIKSQNSNSYYYNNAPIIKIRISDHPSKFYEKQKGTAKTLMDMHYSLDVNAVADRINGTLFNAYKKGDKLIHSYDKVGEVTFIEYYPEKEAVKVLNKEGEEKIYFEEKFFNSEYKPKQYTPAEIRLATGWEKGVDGKWRYEIPDLTLKVSESKATSLENIIDAEELFKAYPDLRYIDINLNINESNNDSGSYTPFQDRGSDLFPITEEINISAKNPESAKSVLIHEIQHAIQEIEGFAKGGNVSTSVNVEPELAKEISQVESVINKAIDLKNSGEWIYESSSLRDIVNSDDTIQSNIKDWALRVIDSGENGIKEFLESTPFNQYKRLAGETEARNAQTRMNYTSEERLNKLLSETADVAPQDQIVIMNALGYPSQIKSATNNDGEFSESSDDIRFKIEANKIKEVEDGLIVLHNVKEAGLSNIDKLGGFPMPSLAITKASAPLTGYGEITLIGNTNLVDPKQGTRTFSADIYSARYPKLTYQISKQGKKVIEKAVELLPKSLQGSAWNRIEGSTEEGLRGLVDSNALKAVFIAERGDMDDIIQKEESEFSQETLDVISKIKGYDFLDVKDNQDVRKQITELYFAEKPSLEKFRDKFTDEDGLLNYNLSKQLFDSAKRYLRVAGRIDETITFRNASAYIEKNKLEKEWKKYATDFYNSLNVEEKIFKGYSPSGTRRYVAHTIENVIKSMKTKNLRGAEKYFYGAGSVRAKVAPEFKSISDIKKHSESLMSEKEFEEVKDEINKEFSSLLNKLEPFYKYERDMAEFLSEEIISLSNRGVSESFNKLSDEVRTDLVEFIEKIKNAPTGYFEAKPTREVSLSEFNGAVIPDDSSDETKSILDRNNIPYVEYSTMEDRIKKVRAFSEDLGIRFSIKSPIGFYSTVENALDKIQQEKGTKEQFKKMLLNNGAKQAEMDWMGFDELPEKLTKADIQNWIDENRIEVEEVVKGGDVSESEIESLLNDEVGEGMTRQEAIEYLQNDEGNEQPKFSQYVLPGGENYKELLLTMPGKPFFTNQTVNIKVNDEWLDTRGAKEKLGIDDISNIQTGDRVNGHFIDGTKQNNKETNSNFRSSHFDEPNILAHIRFDERTVNGERVLFIQEFQSDWAQKGKKEGFKDNNAESKINDLQKQLKSKYPDERMSDILSMTEDPLVNELTKLYDEKSYKKVPDMPFKKTDQWLNLAARRMMRYAAENGFDRIAWTNGEQQADRYDLSKQVDDIWTSEFSNSWNGKQYEKLKDVEITLKGGEVKKLIINESGKVVRGDFEGESLDNVVGKEMAEKIIGAQEDTNFGEQDLKVGGEGMKAFYDGIVPSTMSKLGKPFGAKVENIEMPETGTQQSIPVTDSMKETVMEGIPLFKISGERGVAEYELAQKVRDILKLRGIDKNFSVSNTDFGNSMYFTVYGENYEPKLKVRISDHGVTNINRIWGEQHESAKSDPVRIANDIELAMFPERYNKIEDGVKYYSKYNNQRVFSNVENGEAWVKESREMNEKELNNLSEEKARIINKEFVRESKSGNKLYKVELERKHEVFPVQVYRYERKEAAPELEDPLFSIKAPKFEPGASLKEMVTTSNMFIAARADKYGAKGRRMVESEIKTVGRAISEQTANLKESANLVTGMVKALLNNGSMNHMTRAELSQILTNVRNASNKKDLTKEFDKISSIVRQIQLRNAKRRFNDLMKFKVQDKNAKGISIASTVDDETVSIITTIRKSLKELTLEDVENQINEINNLDEKTTSDETKLVGLGIARDYMNEIKTREAQLSELSEELSKAKEDLVGKEGKNRLTGTQLVNSIEVQISQVKSEMTSAYDDLSARLNKIIAEGKEALKNIKLQDKERVATLSHFVNSDMKGIEPKNNPEKGRTFKQWLKSNLIISPLQSFDFMLRSLAPNQVAGNGYLHDHFARGILKASQDAYEGTESAFKMIDEAVAKIFGDKFTFRYVSARDFKKMSKYELTYGTEKSSTTITATNGQLAYIYAVNKMTDGAMKLRAMGISEEQVEEMKAALPVRIVKLVDVIQDEILPKLRVKYNNVHLELFNTSMASIENYFPLHIDKTALTQKVDLEEESNKLSGLIKNSTKSIIKRTVNTKPIDIRNSDFSDILTDHIKDMEQWAAFASIRRDMNTLLSNRNFLNRLIELGGFEYMVQFKRAAAIAVDVYQPLSDSYDTAITGVARTVATSKVMLNLYTAFKQALAIAAYLTEPSPKFQGKVLVNLVKGHASFKWAKDNLPDFRKRWESSALGDEKLSRQFANIASEGDFVKFMDASQKVAQKYGMYPNKMVDSYICAVGAKALYETNYDKYISMGATEEKARERALVDAVNLYNTTQQSSESMFVSSVQLDRTFFSTAYTVFNNASLAYNRQVFDAARNLKNAFNNRANLIENRTKFNMRTFNVSEEASKKAATKEVDTQIMRDVLRLAVFGYGVQLVWRLGTPFIYLLFGDDDDKKKKMVKEAATGGALITPIRGLLFGATFESVIDGLMDWVDTGSSYAFVNRLTGNIHPVISDVDQLARAAVNKNMTAAKVGYLLLNLGTKLGWGIDLKPFANFTYGFVELMDSDELTANDVLIDIMSMLSVPQSQLKALALDNPETFFDRYIELKELVDYGLLAPVLELNPDDLDNYINSGRRYMSREMKEKVEK